MTRKKSEFSFSGQAHPEIRPGDIYQDIRGAKITIKAVSDVWITFTRGGYENECICSPERLQREFAFVPTNMEKLTEWRLCHSPLEKIQKLKNLINAGRMKQGADDE